MINGPGTADMKGGVAVMLAALKAIETSDAAGSVGYDVIINSDEEVGSLGSAPLIAEAARGKRAALTYEPSALPDGTLAGARPGSGNFAIPSMDVRRTPAATPTTDAMRFSPPPISHCGSRRCAGRASP